MNLLSEEVIFQINQLNRVQVQFWLLQYSVSIPSDSLFSFLWVVVAKAALFRGLLHINAARKVAAVHSMQWQQLSLRYFWVPLLLVCSWCTSLSLEFHGRSLWSLEYIFELYLLYLRRYSSSDNLPICILLIKALFGFIFFITHHSISVTHHSSLITHCSSLIT